MACKTDIGWGGGVSATIDVARFAKHFGDAPIVEFRIANFATQVFDVEAIMREKCIVSQLVGFIREEFFDLFRTTEFILHLFADFGPML